MKLTVKKIDDRIAQIILTLIQTPKVTEVNAFACTKQAENGIRRTGVTTIQHLSETDKHNR
jgi:dUTPase